MKHTLLFITGCLLSGFMIPFMAKADSRPATPADCVAQASFTASDTCAGYPVAFTNTTCVNCSNISFEWNFGDGSPVVGDKSPKHLYTAPGTYTVILTAKWNGVPACSTVFERRVVVRPFENCCPTQPLRALFDESGGVYIGDVVSFSFTPVPKMHPGYEVYWMFGDTNIIYNEVSPTHIYRKTSPLGDDFPITLWAVYKNEPTGKQCLITNNLDNVDQSIAVHPLYDDGGECCDGGTFAPQPGKKYVLSAWVNRYSTYVPTNTYASISIIFSGANVLEGPFYPKGNIIDGWQKIEGIFTVPDKATSITVNLNNEKDEPVRFDDIRIFPTDANMKSYVYDPLTKKLVAELDENNYATFYEYDEEGQLIRVKKETERGKVTIKESRSSTAKTNQD